MWIHKTAKQSMSRVSETIEKVLKRIHIPIGIVVVVIDFSNSPKVFQLCFVGSLENTNLTGVYISLVK
jgi:hypothetical protein